MKETNIKKLIHIIFKAVALALGVAVVALSIMNELDTTTAITLLGIGCASSGAAHIMDKG